MYFPQDLLFICDKYDELRKTLFHKIKSLLCPNVNINSFKNEINTYLVELFLQGSDDLSMDDNIVQVNFFSHWLKVLHLENLLFILNQDPPNRNNNSS
jgi:hypothetical protein